MPCCAVPGWVGLCRCNSGSCWGWLSPSGSLRAVCVCCAHVIPPIPRTAALALTALAPTCRSFVNFKKVADATRAYEQLVGEVRSFCVIFMHQKLSTLSPQGRSPACEQRLLRALLSGRTGLDRQQPHSALLNPPPRLAAFLAAHLTLNPHAPLPSQVIPELTGTRKLKLQFRPVDSRRGSGRRA